jgi:hypothetical protein
MKNLRLVLFLAALPLIGIGQTKAPKSEFLIELSSSSVEVSPNSPKDVSVKVIPSKSYSKSKVTFGMSSGVPKGVSVTIEAEPSSPNEARTKISVSKETIPGTYLVILNAAMQNKKKGTTLKLIVTADNASETAAAE